jgi:DNA-binding CsgD family transcriptional regulator
MSFLYACVAMFFADIGLWFLGMNAFGKAGYEVIHIFHFMLTLGLLAYYLRDKLSVVTALTIFCVSNQAFIIFEMWLCCSIGDGSQVSFIAGYMVMAGLNLSLALMTYIRVLPLVLGGLSILSYGLCCLFTGDGALCGMFPIFLACFAVVSVGGHNLSGSVDELEQEKREMKESEQKILNLMELDRSQLSAYIALAREKGLSADETGTMLDLVGKKARENIQDNVSYYFRQRGIEYENLQTRLPQLSRSEIEICELILKEKKLKEILRILGKSESNVTSQRTNIRRKLGLSPSEDLRDALLRITTGE